MGRGADGSRTGRDAGGSRAPRQPTRPLTLIRNCGVLRICIRCSATCSGNRPAQERAGKPDANVCLSRRRLSRHRYGYTIEACQHRTTTHCRQMNVSAGREPRTDRRWNAIPIFIPKLVTTSEAGPQHLRTPTDRSEASDLSSRRPQRQTTPGKTQPKCIPREVPKSDHVLFRRRVQRFPRTTKSEQNPRNSEGSSGEALDISTEASINYYTVARNLPMSASIVTCLPTFPKKSHIASALHLPPCSRTSPTGPRGPIKKELFPSKDVIYSCVVPRDLDRKVANGNVPNGPCGILSGHQCRGDGERPQICFDGSP